MRIDALPAECQIKVDGNVMPTTRQSRGSFMGADGKSQELAGCYWMGQLPAGQHVVVVTASGHPEFQRTVTVGAGEQSKVDANLAAERSKRATEDAGQWEKALAPIASDCLKVSPAGSPVANGSPYVRGKAIVVDEHDDGQASGLSGFHGVLPEVVRATRPEEVETIIRISWRKMKVGTYEGGGAAYKYSSTVTVIDRSRSVVIARREFQGSEPPPSIRGVRGAESGGTKTDDQVIAFLKALKPASP